VWCVEWCRSGEGVGLAAERSQVRVMAAPLDVTILGKFFTHMCLCSPSSINWYRRKLRAKQALHATHWPRVRGLAASAGVWLRAIQKRRSAPSDGPLWLGKDFGFVA